LSNNRQVFYKKPLSVFASCRPLLKITITGAHEAKTSSAKKEYFYVVFTRCSIKKLNKYVFIYLPFNEEINKSVVCLFTRFSMKKEIKRYFNQVFKA